jgi:hypothetical protein
MQQSVRFVSGGCTTLLLVAVNIHPQFLVTTSLLILVESHVRKGVL